MQVILDNWPLLLQGIGTTVALTVLGYGFALVLGTVLAVCRVSPIPPLRWAATVYVEIFRNIPLLSLLVLLAFGLPDAGLLLPYFWCGVLGLTLSGAAFVCENVRSGINTVPIGHAEAARSIGLGFFGVLRHVVLPQAFRTMVQPLVNVFIATVIGSSLCAAISVVEITYVTQQLNIASAQAVLLFVVAGALYLALSLGVAYAGRRVERAVSPGGGRSPRTAGSRTGVAPA
ncbi:amino acid ABC transporter permease [Brachybacterium endophyticum]|uniref:Amino acid ABC transporter permease n=1 Tax=Brachybacterium endophyticum TaxID=2182385 RepID=A0A2U2RJY9_9MICO|nr:amino acid ABC transporter permease [Brachybacterium endophyticum]PWH06188.1 amino acid ABC transporter permease [Brachybacterium endophyticum]